MGRQLCTACGQPMEFETIGRRPSRVISYCHPCNLAVIPFETPPDYPRSSADRIERATPA